MNNFYAPDQQHEWHLLGSATKQPEEQYLYLTKEGFEARFPNVPSKDFTGGVILQSYAGKLWLRFTNEEL